MTFGRVGFKLNSLNFCCIYDVSLRLFISELVFEKSGSAAHSSNWKDTGIATYKTVLNIGFPWEIAWKNLTLICPRVRISGRFSLGRMCISRTYNRAWEDRIGDGIKKVCSRVVADGDWKCWMSVLLSTILEAISVGIAVKTNNELSPLGTGALPVIKQDWWNSELRPLGPGALLSLRNIRKWDLFFSHGW